MSTAKRAIWARTDFESDNDARTLNRRELSGHLLTFGLAVPAVLTMAAAQSATAVPASGIAANGPERNVKFRDGTVVTALGQGSARLGQGARRCSSRQYIFLFAERLRFVVVCYRFAMAGAFLFLHRSGRGAAAIGNATLTTYSVLAVTLRARAAFANATTAPRPGRAPPRRSAPRARRSSQSRRSPECRAP